MDARQKMNEVTSGHGWFVTALHFITPPVSSSGLITKEDERVCRTMMSYWANFARSRWVGTEDDAVIKAALINIIYVNNWSLKVVHAHTNMMVDTEKADILSKESVLQNRVLNM